VRYAAWGRGDDAVRLETWAEEVKQDFQRLLVPGGALTGYALFEEGLRVHIFFIRATPPRACTTARSR